MTLTRNEMKMAISGSVAGVVASIMMELKEDSTEKDYDKTVNELIGLDDTIDILDLFTNRDNNDTVACFIATNTMIDYILQDDDRTSISKRAMNVMNTKNGKSLFTMMYSSIGMELYDYADRVFDYTYHLHNRKLQCSVPKYIGSTVISYGILAIIGLITNSMGAVLSPIPLITIGLIWSYNTWSYNKLLKKKNHQTPQDMLNQTDRFEKFDLLNRCVSDMKEISGEKHKDFITKLSMLAEKQKLLVDSALDGINRLK